MRTLHTPRCTLEPQLEAHAAEMFAVLADPAIYEFENEPPSSAQWLAQRYRRLESRGPEDGSEQWLNWVVRLPGGAELREHHGAHTFVAVLKVRNFRSEALLRSLCFEPGDPQQQAQYRDEPDELVMVRPAVKAGH